MGMPETYNADGASRPVGNCVELELEGLQNFPTFRPEAQPHPDAICTLLEMRKLRRLNDRLNSNANSYPKLESCQKTFDRAG